MISTLPRPLRLLLLWAGLVAVYAAGLTLPAAPGRDLSQTEAHRLLVAHSIVTDRDIDLLDEYIARPYEHWGGIAGVRPGAALANNVAVRRDERGREGPPLAPGGFVEPSGLGLGAVLAPAYWVGRTTGIGGPLAVQLWCAGLLAAAFVLALGLARRIVPDPWATRGVVVVALSPPIVLGATQIGPTAPTALLLTGAVSAALAVRDHPRTGAALACATLCALVPWIWLPLAPAALVVAAALTRWMRRRRRGLMGYLALEVLLLSAFILLTVNDRIYGGPTPWAPQVGWSLPMFFDGAWDVARRIVVSPVGLLVDRDFGLLRWAPVLGLVGVAVWRLVHWRRSRLFRVFADEIHVEVSVLFLLLVLVAATVPYAILSPWPATNWLGGAGAAAALPVVAATVGWAWQRVPRAGAGLAALTLVGTLWLLGAGVLDGGAATDPQRGALPWAGAARVLPEIRR
ncbi:hypothetical protein [Patulibacter minatonensis]|uniref:hypothetical protein n=1 Tax=Patulibacter minatonensis TaxID=298163 RepID=UPI00047A926C|nr:hypothetical protein [Patulibacter minatonensis]